ncbi:hypothetical protein PVAP13_7KG421701 [Panicum virgatum]|uniref:Uncharacterized protein n=1 Tax=Panicum virgatum TaxID=38727 RepID=A0A8T0QQ31_PANVG|nr:hypothetical protein PVAP13_7KG421701 [Panicum virgatum]
MGLHSTSSASPSQTPPTIPPPPPLRCSPTSPCASLLQRPPPTMRQQLSPSESPTSSTIAQPHPARSRRVAWLHFPPTALPSPVSSFPGHSLSAERARITGSKKDLSLSSALATLATQFLKWWAKIFSGWCL